MKSENYGCNKLPENIQKYILEIVARPIHPGQKNIVLRNILSCRAVCKRWHTICTTLYDEVASGEIAVLSSIPFLPEVYKRLPEAIKTFISTLISYNESQEVKTALVKYHFLYPNQGIIKKLPVVAQTIAQNFHRVDKDNNLAIAILLNSDEVAKGLILSGAQLEYEVFFDMLGMPYCYHFDAIALAKEINNNQLVEFIKIVKPAYGSIIRTKRKITTQDQRNKRQRKNYL